MKLEESIIVDHDEILESVGIHILGLIRYDTPLATSCYLSPYSSIDSFDGRTWSTLIDMSYWVTEIHECIRMKPFCSFTNRITRCKREKAPIIPLPTNSREFTKRSKAIHMTRSEDALFEEHIWTFPIDAITLAILCECLSVDVTSRKCVILIQSKFGKWKRDITKSYSVKISISNDNTSNELSRIFYISDKSTKRILGTRDKLYSEWETNPICLSIADARSNIIDNTHTRTIFFESIVTLRK